MSVLDHAELQASSLADLHAIADQLGVEGFRRMRKADLIDAILGHSPSGDGGGDGGRDGGRDGDGDGDGGHHGDGEGEPESSTGSRSRRLPLRARRSRRTRAARGESGESGEAGEAQEEEETAGAREAGGAREAAGAREAKARSSRGEAKAGSLRGELKAGGSRGGEERTGGPREERTVTGVVELLGNGSAFLRVHPPESSDEDVYISAAQVRRCELVSGDRVSGPLRTPRRSERYPSLVRVDTINDTPAGEIAEGVRYDDRPVAYPTELLTLSAGDAGMGVAAAGPVFGGMATGVGGGVAAGPVGAASESVLREIERLAPFGRGSRVVIAGPARSGKTTLLRELLNALSGREGLESTLVLCGVRPEEIAELGDRAAVALSFAAAADAQDQAVGNAIDTAKRVAARGGDALVAIDTLDGLHPHAARKALAAARNLTDGGSLTIIATACKPLGGETTVIALDPESSGAGRAPSLDARTSGTVRAELLVGARGAAAIG